MSTHSDAPTSVVIVGAGLAGCLLATLLGRRGMQVEVFERRSDPRVTGAERGRSINLALSARGLHALELVGLREVALDNALPMPGRMVHPVDGEPKFQAYSADGQRSINSISRSLLNTALLETAEATAGVTVHFDHKLESLDVNSGRLTLSTPDGTVDVVAGVVLGNDGAYSKVRAALKESAGISVAEDFLSHGYKELSIPAKNGEFALNPDALHIWGRGDAMMIALPNLDRSFTCTLFWPTSGPGSFESLSTPDQILTHFRANYGDAVDVMPNLVDEFQNNPVGSLVTVRSWPWAASGESAHIALVGDAAHAIVPFYGQGANCAFEDTVEIDRLLDVHGDDWSAVLGAYQRERRHNTDAIAEMALDNFIEMRDRVNSPAFRAKSAAVHMIERVLPGRYESKYELVSFSTVPYSQIPARLRDQNVKLLAAVGGAVTVAFMSLRFARRH